jgi:hypothetical protein
MTDITTSEFIELGMLAGILCLAAVLLLRERLKPDSKKSRDDGSSYFVG